MSNFNFSGGKFNIGNIVEGNNNHVVGGAQSASANSAAFGRFFKDLEPAAASAGRPDDEIAALRNDVTELQHALQASPSQESLVDKAHRLYNKYIWAGGLLKGLFAIVLPGLKL